VFYIGAGNAPPAISIRALADDLRYYRRVGVKRVLSQFRADVFAQQPAALYAWTHLTWDTDLDPDALIKEFCRAYYGAAGESMAALHALVEDVNAKRRATNLLAVYAPDVVKQARALLDQADQAVANDKLRRDRVAVVRSQVDRAAALTPPEAVRDRLDPAGVLPRAIGSMRIEAVMGFDRPWDISALETARPGITHLDLGELHADWGDLVLRAAGTLAVDPRGYPTGDIAVRAENWREMIVLASNAGAIPEGMRGTLETALGFLSGLSGRPEDIEAQLAFRDERVFFGPIPIGPAPRLILR